MDVFGKNKPRRKMIGCYGAKRKKFFEYKIESYGTTIEYYSCPGNFRKGEIGYVFALFEQFQKGLLPFEGPFSDQPAKVVEAFNLIVSLREEQRAQKEEENKKLSRRKNGR